MDQSYGGNQDDAGENKTIYPDLDFVPSYPWSWQSNAGYPPNSAYHLGFQNHHESRETNAFEPAQRDYEMSDNSEELYDHDVSLINATYDPTDRSVDPDYHVSEESVVYVNFL